MIKIKDKVERHKFIFNVIAPIYASLDNIVKKGHHKAIKNVINIVDLKGKRVLDIGTGAAAWGALFMEYGADVHGVDFAQNMITKAKKIYGKKMKFSVANAMDLSHIDNNSYDIVTASFVLHGFPYEKRNIILKEMHRISKDIVIINDYYGHTPALGRFLEFLEGSDYKNFKKEFITELKDLFTFITVCNADAGQAVYFGAKNKDYLKNKSCVKETIYKLNV
jgi:ubiquinone/menaquinone biosynthesis C-methylase UbiE